MKSVLSRNLLELALSHCFDATEKKVADSYCQLDFKNNSLKLTTKGAFTAYEESIDTIKCDSDCVIAVKTWTILEFVKYINSEELMLSYDDTKKVCLISSSDKKSKLALPQTDVTFDEIKDDNNNIFEIDNSAEFIAKLGFASKFCSNNFQDHPLTNIHCSLTPTELELKAANGPAFYSSKIKVKGSSPYEFYLPKKTPTILKNIFDNESLEKISINKNSIILKSQNNCLQVFVEKTQDSFPDQILEQLDKTADAEVKISIYELSKALKFFNDIFADTSVIFTITKDNIELSAADNENQLAAKEQVASEASSGDAKSSYKSKLFLDCLDALQSSWVNLHFVEMQDSFYLCKMCANDTLTLLCPAIS